MPERHFRLCSVICIFLQNKWVKTQTNFILLRVTHYSSKPESMSEIDFSRFATDFEVCLILTDIHSELRSLICLPRPSTLPLLTINMLHFVRQIRKTHYWEFVETIQTHPSAQHKTILRSFAIANLITVTIYRITIALLTTALVRLAFVRIKKWPIVVCPIRFHNFKQ